MWCGAVAALAGLGLAAAAFAAPAPEAPNPATAGAPAWPGASGPFTTGNDFLLSVGFLAAHPGLPEMLPDGAWEVEVGYGVANTFAKSQPLNGLFASDKPGAMALERARTSVVNFIVTGIMSDPADTHKEG